jgi:AcrR family transcriptional regulator
MAAGRPRTFCTTQALDAAMLVFWSKGYEGASMVDLTTAIGINSPSLYAAFGSKEGLFKAVLERYDERRQEFMDMILSAPTAQDTARLFLHGVADFCAATGGKTPPGCLFLQSGLAGCDHTIPDVLAKHRAEKEKALRDRFERSRLEGDLPDTACATTLARYLTTMGNGMAVQATSGATVEELHTIADIALSSFPVCAKAKSAVKDLVD